MTEFFGLQPGEVFRFQPYAGSPKHWPAVLDLSGGQVIAVDQDSRPALVANTFGAGKTLLCAYPLESYLAVRPAAFEGPENSHKIYQAFREWAGVTPLFSNNRPPVEIASLIGKRRGYTILVNHSSQRQAVVVSTHQSIKTLKLLTPGGPQEAPVEPHGWQASLEGYGGCIFEWTL